MKFKSTAFGMATLALAVTSLNVQAQTLEDVIVEEYSTQGSFKTYRVFLDMGDGDRLLTVFGYDDENPSTGNSLSFSTSTTFFQDPLGSDKGEQILLGLVPSFPSVARDSWLSVGGAGSIGTAMFAAIPKEQDDDGSAIVDFENPDGYISSTTQATNDIGIVLPGSAAVSEIATPDGAYFIAGGAEGVGPENVICIGQFTTDGDFSFEINVQLQNGDEEQLYLHTNSEQPDGSTGVVDDRLIFTSAFVCENPFPAVEEASLTSTPQANRVVAGWDPVPNQIGCQIQVRFAGGSVVGAKIIGGSGASSFNIPYNLLQAGTDYEWRVRCGCSQTPLVAGSFSSWQLFSTPASALIESSPNPTTGQSFVAFSVPNDQEAVLEVYDMSGRKIAQVFSGWALASSEYRFEFDGSSLPNGVYIYRLNTSEEVITDKFMIAR